jgi:PKD repeat protein
LAASVQLVAAYDGTLAPYPTTFFQMMPGPDGRIYICTSYDNNVWHVIEHPNEPGIACEVRQHVIALPARSSWYVPNFANYRLGPLDGSSCDTLGIDNPPIAHFQYNVVDTLSPLQVEFTDLSHHEPVTWLWDFGDGHTSQDTSPVHLYAAPGTYQVCLTVCNANTCDTECQELELDVVSTATVQGSSRKLMLSPNPTTGLIEVGVSRSNGRLISVYNVQGQKIQTLTVAPGTLKGSLDLGQHPNGLYWVVLSDDTGRVIGTAKVSVAH